MKGAVIVALLGLALLTAGKQLTEQQYQYEFAAYQQEQGKTYAPDSVAARYAAFKANYDYVQQQNAKFASGESTFEVEMNQFADLTTEEFAQLYLTPFNSTRPKNVVFLPEVASNDGSVDWRAKNAVTPVKNQGQCGSCWSFSTTGSVEGAWAIAKGNLVSVSEQQLVDCSSAYGNQGCNGGLMDNAFKYIIANGGLDTEADYPYTARDGSCDKTKQAKHAVSITSFQDVPQSNEDQLLAAVSKGPVSVAIEADQQAFQLYKSGVFNGECGTQLDHGVLVVGYGMLNNLPYWIVKNSWGPNWGLQGYILLSRGQKGAAGQCGVAMQPSYPIVGSGPSPSPSPSPAPPAPSPPAPSPPAPSPPSPSVDLSATHYEAPPCQADETQVQITGISGDFCSPKCSKLKPCPTDVPAGTTAQPQCVLEMPGHTSPTNCALICTPGASAGCPSGATCQPIQGTGICTYPQA